MGNVNELVMSRRGLFSCMERKPVWVATGINKSSKNQEYRLGTHWEGVVWQQAGEGSSLSITLGGKYFQSISGLQPIFNYTT